jgi:hypothetical protein
VYFDLPGTIDDRRSRANRALVASERKGRLEHECTFVNVLDGREAVGHCCGGSRDRARMILATDELRIGTLAWK